MTPRERYHFILKLMNEKVKNLPQVSIDKIVLTNTPPRYIKNGEVTHQ